MARKKLKSGEETDRKYINTMEAKDTEYINKWYQLSKAEKDKIIDDRKAFELDVFILEEKSRCLRVYVAWKLVNESNVIFSSKMFTELVIVFSTSLVYKPS